MVISVKIKFRPSQVEGREGVLYFQLIAQRVCYIHKTNYRVFPTEWDGRKSLIIIPPQDHPRYSILSKIRKRLRWEWSALARLSNKMLIEDDCVTVDEILETWKEFLAKLSFFDFMLTVIDKLISNNRIGTSMKYLSAMRSFNRFLRTQDITLYEITSDLVYDYQNWLINNGVCLNTVSFYMRILRAVFNRAIKQNLILQTDPFADVYTGIAKTKKRAVTIDCIQRIKDVDIKRKKNLEFARDLFLFSFYCRGMSFVDIAMLTQNNVSNGYLIYNRQKTGQRIIIKCEPQIQDILNKYHTKDSHLFPIINDDCNSSYNQYIRMNKCICRWLKDIGRLANIDIPLTIYVARHSWTSIANQRNHPLSVISKALGHSSEKTTRVYLAELDNSMVDETNKDIINELK